MAPLLWGLLLVAGGFLTWKAVPRPEAEGGTQWTAESPSTTASLAGSGGVGMTTGIEMLGRESPPLLRMQWPAQTGAVEYRILFHVDGQAIASPLTSPTPVFLYDLESNILGLPDRFDWAVAAVFSDGRERVSPWQHHAAP